MNHLGPEGYHWRVCVEDKPVPGEHSARKTFSWWDIQDENAALPVKEASQHQLSKFFGPPKIDHSDEVTKAAKGAFKSLGKAVSHAVGADEHSEGPRVRVVAFKLLDIVKMHDDFEKRNHGRGGGHIPQPAAPKAPKPRVTAAARPPQRASAPAHMQQQQRAPAQPPPPQQQQRRPPPQQQQPTRQPQQQQANLMDFGAASTTSSSSGGAGRSLHHSTSLPNSFDGGAPANETRAQKLKREYAQKHQQAQRVWDDVDQRWVEVDKKSNASGSNLSGSSNGGAPKKKEVGISLDPANAVGKSANVQAAVNNRVNEMRESQAKALQEVREREERKKMEEAEEDEVRKRLEPRIKAWSEEHGKKKQLRALLASLHTILWPGANWKQVTIGDLLDDKKVKLAFHKASRVVHPDKAHHLDAEKRFIAKRIFDALCQAKTEFDEGKK